MDYKKMNKRIEGVLTGQYDHIFADITDHIHCMSRPRVYGIINAIVGSLQPGEIYVEVGTYQGGSLTAALYGNDSRAIGVDSFSEFKETNSFERTQANLDFFGVADRVELKNMSFKEFFESIPPAMVIQCYYYDGAHDFPSQLAGMEAAWPYLRPGSIILVDDYSYPEVNAAINQFIANHLEHITIQFVMATQLGAGSVPDETWWNGVVALKVI